jgi:drug/metabolite transporter (DMT)-like permease
MEGWMALNKVWAWMMLLLCSLFWAGNYIVGKHLVMSISPFWITLLRWMLALLFLMPLAYWIEKPTWKSIRSQLFSLALMGGFGVIGFTLISYAALEYTSPTNAAFIEAFIPTMIVIFSVLILKEKISMLQYFGLLLSFCGVLLILSNGEWSLLVNMAFNRGDLLMLLTVIAWTIYSIIGKKVMLPPMTTTAFSSLFGVMMMVPFTFWHKINLEGFNPSTISSILYMAICASVLSYLFWNISVRIVGASQAGISINLVPLFTIIISLLLGESISKTQIVGGMVIITGVYLTTGVLNYSKIKIKVFEKR